MKERLKIIVVDDDRTCLDVTTAILEAQGHEVIQQDMALGTSMTVLREKPDVVLLDIRMPGLSGDRLAALIAARTSGGEGPVVILHSSLSESELRPFATRAGVAGVIEKSASPATFVERFEALMATQKPRAARGTPR